MKRLWKVIPPCLSDLQGFQAVLSETEGMGIIDDPSRYKPIGAGQRGRGSHEYTGRGDYGRRKHGGEQSYENNRHSEYETQPGGFGRRRGDASGVRVLQSDIRNEDIITGTQDKIMAAFERGKEQFSPDFVLLSCAPSASMIGSDLEYAAEKITESSGIPAKEVKIDGEKDYLYGISHTLEAMGKLLLKPGEKIPGMLNILGANTIDWTPEMMADMEKLLVSDGWKILSRWGWKESTENLRGAAAASVNLVVNVSGLRLARYMENEYGIPYAAGAPFGRFGVQYLLENLRQKAETGEPGAGMEECGRPSTESENGEPQVLIAGEQFTANAIRQALYRKGLKEIRVLSFFDMDASYQLPGDRKLTGEDDFTAQANLDSVRLILADPDYRPLVRSDIPWIGLPNRGSASPVNPAEPFPMAGDALDAWIAEQKYI